MNSPSILRARATEAANGRLRAQIRALFRRPRRAKPPTRFPRTVSHYQLLKEIGAGARGTVYLARDRRSDRLVAIKALRGYADQESEQRFLREAECLSAVNHPNIVKVHKIIHRRESAFIVMEYLSGRTLNRVIAKRGLPLKTCYDYALQIARAIAAIHSASMIHRDLKPTNFVITKNGIIKLLDFGLAKVTSNRRGQSRNKPANAPETWEGTILGTPGYMSPEQVRGQAADQRSDIFSFGAILYEMLTGQRAFQESTEIETMSTILHKLPPKLPLRIPWPIGRVVRRCLEKNPTRRYQTAEELIAVLGLAAEVAFQ
jgi:eukaryotic-like serine/threonine-protein kinase